MTLTRRIALFIAALLLLALGGALVIHTLAARDVLLQQQDSRNRDAAASLALALSQQGGDKTAMLSVATAQFDLGHYRSIQLVAADGSALISLQQPAQLSGSPDWFNGLLPLRAADGMAIVSSGWQELGTLTVSAHVAWAQHALWQASVRSASLLALLAAIAAIVSTWMLRAWQRPLRATIRQAQALARGQFIEADLPSLPELQELTRSMNITVGRLRETFAAQAEQVVHLQRQAQLDPLTGLALQPQWLQVLSRRQVQQDHVALLLVHVQGLAAINAAHGREQADALLRCVAGVLKRHSSVDAYTFAGRLAGPEMALLLPPSERACDRAARLYETLYEALRQAFAPLGLGQPLLVVAYDGAPADSAEEMLSLLRTQLPQAQAGGGLCMLRRDADASEVVVSSASPARPAASQPLAQAATQPAPHPTPDPATQPTDRRAHKAQAVQALSEALAQGRAALGEFQVQDAQGRLLHLECPLRLQLQPSGEFQPAAQWLALARRAGLTPQVDLCALTLALRAIERDGQARAINVELRSLVAPGFVQAVAARLAAAPRAARHLWVEWTEGASSGDWAAAGEATTCWRALGVQIGVEHAGSAPEQLPRWRDMGVDYVKVDALHLRGAATNTHVRAYAHSLAGLIRLLGLKAIAEGVEDSADLAVLWQLGYEGATGTALTAPRQLGTEPAVTPERAKAAPGVDAVASNKAPAPTPAPASASASASDAAPVPAPASALARTAQSKQSLTGRGRSSGLNSNSRPAPLGTR